MDIKQVYTLVNQATAEALGKQDIVAPDLSNIVDVGKSVFDAETLDKFIGSLVDHIGKVVFVDRPYTMRAPSVLMDGWEYGGVMEKISQNELPDASINNAWELEDGKDYPVTVYNAPKNIEAKYFNKKTTFTIAKSYPDYQLKPSFSSAEQMRGFISMLDTYVENSLQLKNERLIMYTLCNAIGESYYSDIGTKTSSETTGNKAVNLLKLYNDETGEGLTVANCLSNTKFLKYASYKIKQVSDNIRSYSSLFNVGGVPRFTPKDRQKLILLSDFTNRADTFLQSDTFHNELTKLPGYESVPFWQGSGTDFSLNSISKVNIKTASGHDVTIDHVIGVVFDRDALGVCNQDRRARSFYNSNGDFVNYWYKMDASYFNDLNENVVVFFIA